MSPAPVLTGLTIAGDAAAWARLGFAVTGATCRIGSTTLQFEPGEQGVVAWTLSGTGEGDIDGLATAWLGPGAAAGGPGVSTHPNGALYLDHVVVTTSDPGRTTAALEDIGLPCRRVRDAQAGGRPVRQAFFRLGEVILEVVGPREPERAQRAAFWGLVAVVEDLDACAAELGDDLGAVRAAVQPGRRIATVRRSSGITLPLALMTPGRQSGSVAP